MCYNVLKTGKKHLIGGMSIRFCLLAIDKSTEKDCDLETPVSFGEWLKRRRKTLDLTQEELADRASCSVFALRKIESGERRPSKQLALLLASALEISEQEQPTFIRVARGELNLERLRNAKPDHPHDSITTLLAKPTTSEMATVKTDLESAPHPLPLPPTPLLGRESELASLERIFKDPECRLLTLTGMGGIGKTRLAIEFAARQEQIFADGIFYVPLAAINSIDAIVPAIAEVLECPFEGPMDLKEQLIKHMSVRIRRSALLVLDNLEHLIAQSPATVKLVSELLERLPPLKILTTSRERLNLHGEWMYEIHGLPIPPAEFFNNIDDYSATVLFVHSAKRIRTGFEINDTERRELVRICRLLEGIPLAIELAAAWTGMLSCAEIAQEIESNIDFLSTSMRDMPERHRSLRATFDHSWKLLSAQERDVLARLSVFHGGFDRQAAEKVAGATLPLLASLVAKSLVLRTDDGRYDLHEVIRQYTKARLNENSSALNETCDHHSEYFLLYIREREKSLKSGAQQDAMRELTREMDNLRAAWSWAIERNQFLLLGSAVRGLGWMFEVSGLLREGIEQLEQLIKTLKMKMQDETWNKVLGTALVHQGLLYFRKGQFAHSQELYKESIAILRPSGDQLLLADALVYLGIITHLNGDFDTAQSLLEEGLACAKAADDAWIGAFAILNLGYINSQRGFYNVGYEQMVQGLQTWRALGDPHSISMGLNFMVPTLLRLGRHEEARSSMYESIALCEQTRNRWGKGTAHRFLGLALAEEGHYADARVELQKSLEIFRDYTEGWDIARTLSYLGDVTQKAGDLKKARAYYLDALPLAIQAQAMPIVMDSLLGLAQLDMKIDHPEGAYELCNFVLKHPASTEDARDGACRLLRTLEPCLTVEQIKMLQERGNTQSLESIANKLLLK